MAMKSERPGKKLLLVNKEIDITKSEILFDEVVTTENYKSLFEFHNSEWSVENGWLTGKNPDESAGMAIFRKEFPGNILLEFEGRTVLPSTRDINFMWNTEWCEKLNSCGTGYIGSICGWWTKRVGIEKSPDFKLRATTAGFDFEPGINYKVHAGGVDGNCFIFIDGRLFIEIDVPDPIDKQLYNKIALSCYSSIVQFRNIKIRQINWKHIEMSYTPEF
jgi:hypothetical protein